MNDKEYEVGDFVRVRIYDNSFDRGFVKPPIYDNGYSYGLVVSKAVPLECRDYHVLLIGDHHRKEWFFTGDMSLMS